MRTKINPSFQSVSLNTVSISSVGTEKEGRQRLLRRAEYRSELDVTLCASDTRRRKHQLEALTERVGPSPPLQQSLALPRLPLPHVS